MAAQTPILSHSGNDTHERHNTVLAVPFRVFLDGGSLSRVAGNLNRLTVRQVKTLAAPGRYANGSDLYLKIRTGGSRQCRFMFARIKGGKPIQTKFGLNGVAPLTKQRGVHQIDPKAF